MKRALDGRAPDATTSAASETTYVADATISVVANPQFIATKMASVAPTTESAPLMPHAQVSICGARALSSRMPAGIGTPSTTPIGTSVATAIAMRVARENGIAHVTSGVMTPVTAI